MGKRNLMDKDNVLKWVFIGLGGVFGLVATIFDTRHKDKVYAKTLDQKIEAQAKKLMEENKAA